MEELVRKCFLLSLRPSYARGNHIIVHGGQPCFWPWTRRMQFKQGLWNVKRLLLRMMHRREVFPWEFRITPLLDLQFLLLIWTFKESQFSFPLCLKHLLSTRFLLSYLANRSHTTYTPLPSKTWLLPPPQPPTQNRLSLNEFHFPPIFAVFSVLSITSYFLISYLERLLRFTFVFAQVLKWSAHLGYVHCIHFTSEAHAIWICMWYVHSRYLLLVTPYQNLHQGRCSVIPCESGMWIKVSFIYLIFKSMCLSVYLVKIQQGFLGAWFRMERWGPWPLTFVCLFSCRKMKWFSNASPTFTRSRGSSAWQPRALGIACASWNPLQKPRWDGLPAWHLSPGPPKQSLRE